MKKEEVSKRYCVPMNRLTFLESAGIFQNTQYSDEDIKTLSLVLTLQNIGLEMDEIKQYIEGQHIGNRQKIEMLENQRHKIVQYLHAQQKHLDTIDYLVYELKQTL